MRIYTELLAENPDSTDLRLAWSQTNYDIGHGLSTNEKYAESIGYFQQELQLALQKSPNDQ